MANTNSNLSVVKQILFERATVLSHGDNRGKTPEDMGFKIDALSHLDIGGEPGRLMVKAFYNNSRLCFYHFIPEKHLHNWVEALIEFVEDNPFENVKKKKDDAIEAWG